MRSSSTLVLLRESLKDIIYPASKMEIIAYAREHGANENVIEVLQELPVKYYGNIQEVSECLINPEEEEDVRSKQAYPEQKIGLAHTEKLTQ